MVGKSFNYIARKVADSWISTKENKAYDSNEPTWT